MRQTFKELPNYLYLQKHCSYVHFFYIFMVPVSMPVYIYIVFMSHNDACGNVNIHLRGKTFF